MKRTSSLDSPVMIDVLRALGPRSDAVWLSGNAIGLGLTVVAAYVLPRYGVFFVYLAVMCRFALYAAVGSLPRFAYYDLMLRLGAVAGLFEIFADAMLVRWLPNGALVYLTRDAILLESPLYMPIAWACVIVEFGYVPIRIYGLLRLKHAAPAHRVEIPDHGRGTGHSAVPAAGERVGSSMPAQARPRDGGLSGDGIEMQPSDPLRSTRTAAPVAILAGALVAGLSIGAYEFLAFRAGWWKYLPAHVMIGPYCAAYIPLGESFMFAGILPIFAAMSRSRDPRRLGAIVGGVVFAGLILVSYAAAYFLLEAGRAPA